MCANAQWTPGERQGLWAGSAEACEGTLLAPYEDDVCERKDGATCELNSPAFRYRLDAAFEPEVTFCGAYVCEAGEACSCPECEGNEFCWLACEHSAGEGTLCDAPGGEPSQTGAWCCPFAHGCAEEAPLTCEPA
jgi:hypothetical protein